MERSSVCVGGGERFTDSTKQGVDKCKPLSTTEEDSRTQTKVKVLSSCEVHRGEAYFHFLVSIS